MGDAEDDGGKESEYERRAEMSKLNSHDLPDRPEVQAHS